MFTVTYGLRLKKEMSVDEITEDKQIDFRIATDEIKARDGAWIKKLAIKEAVE